MKAKSKRALKSVAQSLVSGSWDSAAEMLAPWLDRDAFRRAIEQQERATRDLLFDEEIGMADSFELDYNELSLDDLRDDGVPLPETIAEANYLGWYNVSIQADDGEWALYDLWCALVNVEGEAHIGFFEVRAPD